MATSLDTNGSDADPGNATARAGFSAGHPLEFEIARRRDAERKWVVVLGSGLSLRVTSSLIRALSLAVLERVSGRLKSRPVLRTEWRGGARPGEAAKESWRRLHRHVHHMIPLLRGN